jgi:hypothetical protein
MLKSPMNSSFLSRSERSKHDEYFGILWMSNILSYSVSVTWRIGMETSETIQVPGRNDMIKLDWDGSVFRIASRELHTVTKPDNRLSSYFKRQISIILCNHIWWLFRPDLLAHRYLSWNNQVWWMVSSKWINE